MKKQTGRHVVYKITYLPHLINQTPPYYYIGSKYNYNGNYLGSLASKRVEWFTNGESLNKWWKRHTKEHPENFLFEILEEWPNVSVEDLRTQETIEQIYENALGIEYFNGRIFGLGFKFVPRSEELAKQIGEKNKGRYGVYNPYTHEYVKLKPEFANELIKYGWVRGLPKHHKETLLKRPRPTIETKKKMSESRKGKPWREEVRLARLKNPADGKRCTDGFRIFPSKKQMAEYYNLYPAAVTFRIEKSKKFPDWKYVD